MISKKKKKKKKKKGLRQNSEWFFGRNPKFKGFFRPKLGDLQKKKKKKKKRLRQNFSPKFRKFKRLRGGSFRMGGAIFHFSQKIGLKSTKYMRFCILHKPMGGARAPPAPPPGYATESLALASKPQVLKNCPVLGLRTALFFEPFKLCITIIINGQGCKRICYR